MKRGLLAIILLSGSCLAQIAGGQFTGMFGSQTQGGGVPAYLPAFPRVWVDQNELTCGLVGDPTFPCYPGSPGQNFVSPSYKLTLGPTGGTFSAVAPFLGTPPVNPPCISSWTLSRYTANGTGLQNALNDLDDYRSCSPTKGFVIALPAVASGTAVGTCPATAYCVTTSAVFPQFANTPANSGIILRPDDASFAVISQMPMPSCSGGIQTNVAGSTHPLLRNPDCDGVNTVALSGEATYCSAHNTWDFAPVVTVAANGNGTGYAIGDTLRVTQGVNVGARIQVLSVGGSGNPLSYTLLAGGAGYSNASGLSTFPFTGSGVGATVNITVGATIAALSYDLGTSTHCVASGTFALPNGTNPFVGLGIPGCGVSLSTNCYNYQQFMPKIIATGSNAPVVTCSPSFGSTQLCTGIIGPALWELQYISLSLSQGNTANADLIAVDDRSGDSGYTSQWTSHFHCKGCWLRGDWQTLATGYNQIATAAAFGSCLTCSFTNSAITETLRPDAEGHTCSLSGVQIKAVNNWLEGESSGCFTGGGSYTPTIVGGPGASGVGTFVAATDVQEGLENYTFPLAWIGSPYGNALSSGTCGSLDPTTCGGLVADANPHWGGAGTTLANPTTVWVAPDGVTVHYVSGPQFHDSTSGWPKNNSFINCTPGPVGTCKGTALKFKINSVAAGTFPSSPPATLTLQGNSYNISSITGNGTTATASCTPNCASAVLLGPATISGNSVGGFNGSFTIQSVIGGGTVTGFTFNSGVSATGTGGSALIVFQGPYGITNPVNFIVPGSSLVRKNCNEHKSANRLVFYGSFCNNVDNSGGQSGVLTAMSSRNISGTGGSGLNGQNYQAGLFDLNMHDLVISNGCLGAGFDTRSAPQPGSGGGADTPMQRVAFSNVFITNVTALNPNCPNGTGPGIRIATGTETWKATLTEIAPNVAQAVAYYSMDEGAPLESDSVTQVIISGSGANQIAQVFASNTVIASETVELQGMTDTTSAAGGSSCLNGPLIWNSTHSAVVPAGVGQLVNVLSSPAPVNGPGGSFYVSTAIGNWNGPACVNGTYAEASGSNASGPVGYQYLGIPTNTGVYLADVTTGSCGLFATGTNPGALASTGNAPWNGQFSQSNVTVTFPTSGITVGATANCILSNAQSSPQAFTAGKITVITDGQSPIGAGSSCDASAGYVFASLGLLQDGIFTSKDGQPLGQAGWYNSTACGGTNGEGTVTEQFMNDTTAGNSSGLTASNLIFPRCENPPGCSVDGSLPGTYTEYGNNPNFPDGSNTCTGAGCSPPNTFSFPTTSCAVGFVFSCSGSVPLNLDWNQYGMALGSTYATSAHDGGLNGALAVNTNIVETQSPYQCRINNQLVTCPGPGPYPDN